MGLLYTKVFLQFCGGPRALATPNRPPAQAHDPAELHIVGRPATSIREYKLCMCELKNKLCVYEVASLYHQAVKTEQLYATMLL